MSFHERLTLLLKDEKIRSFEKRMGFSNGSLAKVLAEKRSLGSDRLETILQKNPTWNANWLLTGEGTMYKGGEVERRGNDVVVNDLRKTIIALEKLVAIHELFEERLRIDLTACEQKLRVS